MGGRFAEAKAGGAPGFQIILRSHRNAVQRRRHRRSRWSERLRKIEPERRHQLGAGRASAKSLRGARMEDVIFAGTRDRKPLGMAQVTMTMDDPAAHAPAHENGTLTDTRRSTGVTITRRLYRSGESEYLIDGHVARLRDIQDMFRARAWARKATRSSSRGASGRFFRTSGRRTAASIIEEAAGISKYQDAQAAGGSEARKREAESFARVRHSGRSRAAGEFAEAAGVEGAALRRAAHRDGCAAARWCWRRVPACWSARRPKLALDLNLASNELLRDLRSRCRTRSRSASGCRSPAMGRKRS